MKTIILDADAGLELVMGRTKSPPIYNYLLSVENIVVPQLFLVEISNALGKYVRFSNLLETSALDYFSELEKLPDAILDLSVLKEKPLKLAIENNISAYDATYLVCCQMTGGHLCTLDKKLIKIAESIKIPIVKI